ERQTISTPGPYPLVFESAIRNSLPAPLGHGAADVALGLCFLLVLALVVLLLATGHAQLDLGPAVLEVQPQRYQCEAALRGLAGELGDLALVQEELARPLGLVVELVAHRVFGDVAADQPHLAGVDLGVGVFQAGRPLAEAFDLGALEHDTAL